MLIGNLTRDPELRYTPQGSALCKFSIATNRIWTNDAGERQENATFHRIVAWSKLAEICSQLLGKGDKVFVEGRLSTNDWEDAEGNQHTTTEVVIHDMILLKSQGRAKGFDSGDASPTDDTSGSEHEGDSPSDDEMTDEEIASDDIPF